MNIKLLTSTQISILKHLVNEHCKAVADERKAVVTAKDIQSRTNISNTELRLAMSDLFIHDLVRKDGDNLTIDYKKVSRITKVLGTINTFGARVDQRVLVDIAVYCMSRPKGMATIDDIVDNVNNGTQMHTRLFQMQMRKTGKMFTYEQHPEGLCFKPTETMKEVLKVWQEITSLMA